MKKWFSILLCLVLAGSFLFTSNGTVQADAANPTVTSISGNTKFTTTVIALNDLPGTITSASGLIFPTGFPVGEKQFEGQGVQVSGFTYGTAKACFPITGINQGWGGKVGLWDGKKWELLETTITTPDESSYSWACATVASNGTYALLAWVVDPSKLPSSKPDCSFSLTEFGVSEPDGWHEIPGTSIYEGTLTTAYLGSSTDLTGMNVTLSLLKSIPANAIIMGGTIHGTITHLGGSFYSLYDPHGTDIKADNSVLFESAIFRFDFGSCKIDMPLGAG